MYNLETNNLEIQCGKVEEHESAKAEVTIQPCDSRSNIPREMRETDKSSKRF